MKNTSETNQNHNPGNDRMELEIVARIKGKDGTVIEKTVRIDSAIPNVCDFDRSTKDRFLKDLGELEQAVLSARNQMAEGLAENYLHYRYFFLLEKILHPFPIFQYDSNECKLPILRP